MSESPPDLHMLNVMVADIAASLDFFRRLAVTVSGGTVGAYVQLRMPGGSARNWTPPSRPGCGTRAGASTRPVPGSSSGSRCRPGRQSTRGTRS